MRDLVLFNIAAVVGIRWLVAAARAGPGSVALWLLAAMLFFVPSALAVARLSERFAEQGGLYIWTRQVFGEWHGFVCGWCYWLSNLFYFPNLLLAGVGIAAYTFGAEWGKQAESRLVALPATLTVLWLTLGANIVGLRVGKWLGNAGGAATYAAGALLAGAGAAAWISGTPATTPAAIPDWSWERLNFWSQITFAFTGLELAAVMGGEIRDPRRSLPRAAWISGAAVGVFYVIGTAAVLALLRPDEINIVTGLAQAGAAAGERFGAPWFASFLAALVSLGVLGQLSAWIAGSARIPYVIGLDEYLPPFFGRLHPRWRTPYLAILIQGAGCTVFLLAMQAGDTLRAGYQLLVDMTVLTTAIPFAYIFLAAWKHGLRLSAASGLAVTLFTIAVSLIPPAESESAWLFESKLAGGCLLVILTGRWAFNKGRAYKRGKAL